MVYGFRYYRALESVSIASALSTALTIYPCQIQSINDDSLNSNFLQLGRRSGGRPQRTVHPMRLPVNTVIHTTLVGLEPATFRSLVDCWSDALPVVPPWGTKMIPPVPQSRVLNLCKHWNIPQIAPLSQKDNTNFILLGGATPHTYPYPVWRWVE